MQNFYEELNIAFDANEQTILNALQRLAQSGQYSLEEIQTIKETLLNPEKRAEYNLTLTQNKSKNFYEILNISPNASENIILNAIRRKAESGELLLEQIQEIKETLLDTEKREKYNQTIVVENPPIISQKIQKSQPLFSKSFIFIVAVVLLSSTIWYANYYYKNIYPYRMKSGEKYFFTERKKILNRQDSDEVDTNNKKNPILIEYVSISKNKHGNIATLYQKRPLSAERDDRYNEREKHISLYNIHNKNNNELKQKEEKINKFIGKTKILDKVKLTDNGKLFVFGSQKTYLFDLNSDFVEEIPIGRAMFLNERYLAFDINNVELPFSSKVFQWCKENKNNSWGCTTHGYHQDGMIAFYDLISKEVSNIYITYNGDICGHLGREIVFDKEGEQVGIICHDSFVTKESGDYEHFYKEKMYIYRLKKEKDIIVAVDNIFEKDFHKLKVYKPQFSVNGKEIYFIQAKHPYSIDHHFVRWDINNYKELQSSKIDMHYIYNYHYRPKYNDLFLVGQVNKKTLAMFSKNNSPNITNNPNTMSFYYHNLNKSNGYWDELNPARVNTRDLRNAAKIDHMCDDGFFFSESGNVFMPVCRGYSHTYFIHNGDEKPQYYRKILRKIEDGIDE